MAPPSSLTAPMTATSVLSLSALRASAISRERRGGLDSAQFLNAFQRPLPLSGSLVMLV